MAANSSFPGELGGEEVVEGGKVGIGDVDDGLTDIDTVVAVDFTDLVETDDEGTMDAHETVGGEHLLDSLHREVGDKGTVLGVEKEHDIVFHATDVEDVTEGDLTVFAIDLEEEGCVVVYS